MRWMTSLAVGKPCCLSPTWQWRSREPRVRVIRRVPPDVSMGWVSRGFVTVSVDCSTILNTTTPCLVMTWYSFEVAEPHPKKTLEIHGAKEGAAWLPLSHRSADLSEHHPALFSNHVPPRCERTVNRAPHGKSRASNGHAASTTGF